MTKRYEPPRPNPVAPQDRHKYVRRIPEAKRDTSHLTPAQLAQNAWTEQMKAMDDGFAGFGTFKRMMTAFITGDPDTPGDTKIMVRRIGPPQDQGRLL